MIAKSALKLHQGSKKCIEAAAANLLIATQEKEIVSVVVEPFFEQIDDYQREVIEEIESEIETSEEVSLTLSSSSDEELEISFNLSQESSSASIVKCSQCLEEIHDLSCAKLTCKTCSVKAPANVKQVEVERHIVEKITEDEVVFDFRPFVHNGRLLVYTPTQ
jgi:hypothetical protein